MKFAKYTLLFLLSFILISCNIFKESSKSVEKRNLNRDTTQSNEEIKKITHIVNSNETFGDFVMEYVGIKYKKLEKKINFNKLILISINKQRLYLIKDSQVVDKYKISTAKLGVGNRIGSEKTPLGLHIIAKKIGRNVPLDGRFVSRIYTGKIAKVNYDSTVSISDEITTRILWLKGEEKGINKGKGISSFKRDIYIHGTPDEGLLGTPVSHGCIRMANKAVEQLFNMVSVGTPVLIIKY